MSESYYDILEISRNATEDEIRRSYKKLALKYHPDKNPGNVEAEERFKSIATAYATLSDPIKRRSYDAFGSVDMDSGGAPSFFNPFDIFQSMFQDGGQLFEQSVHMGGLGGGGVRFTVHTFGGGGGGGGGGGIPIDLSKIQEYMSECGIDVDEELDRARSFGMPNIEELLGHVQTLKSKLSGKTPKSTQREKRKKKPKEEQTIPNSVPAPEPVVCDLYVSLANMYEGATKEVKYKIMKNGVEVKRRAQIPVYGKMVVLEGAGHKMADDPKSPRGDVIFNIYQKPEEAKDPEYKYTRINEYDLLIHYPETVGRRFDLTLPDEREIQCEIADMAAFTKMPYVGVIHNYGFMREDGTRGDCYLLFCELEKEKICEEKSEECVKVHASHYKMLFQQN